MEIPAGKFKAQCLRLMDRVKEKREKIVITKRGKPVAQLVPIDEEEPESLFGYLHGLVSSETDIVNPVDVEWEAESRGF